MNEWVVAGIVVAVITSGWGVVKAVSGIIQPLTEQITRLNDTVKTVSEDLVELTERNSKTHTRLFDNICENEKVLKNHEIRIVKLEEHEKKE